MKPMTKKLLLLLSIATAWLITLAYAFDPLQPEEHRLCSGLPEHASWNISEGNKSVVWSHLGDLLNVVIPDWIQIWGALTPRTKEWKTLCTFTCDYWYKLDSSNQTCVEDPDFNPCPEGYYWDNSIQKCEGSTYTYPASIVDGYNYAYELWIESRSIDDADLYGSITKQELAKIISIFSEELSRAKDKNAQCNFTDITDADGDYVDYIISACQYWLMGENNTAFDPYGAVNYALFWTTLSRALWWDLYDEGNPDPYYANHFAALKMLGVINNPDPDSYVLRWYAYSMIYKAMFNEPGDNEVILHNDIPTTETRTFKRNEISRGTVFSWTYTTVKSSKINMLVITRVEGQGYFHEGDATFYLYINGEEVGDVTSTDNIGFSSLFSGINLNPWQTVTVRVDAEINWHTAIAGVYNYGLALLDISSEWWEIETTEFVPIEITSDVFDMDISSDNDSDVILADNEVVLWEFLLTPSPVWSWLAYLDTFWLNFDSWVNTSLDDLVISVGGNQIECEDAWTNQYWSHFIDCNDIDYIVPAEWAEVKVEIRDPDLWVYRTTIAWVNNSWGFYSTRRLVVNPLIELAYSGDDWQKTSYTVLFEGFGSIGDTISNIKLYTEDYSSLEEADNATPIIEVNDEISFNTISSIRFDNLDEEKEINTFRYDSNWKTFIINKSWYPNYFANKLHDLTIHAIQNP